MARIILGILIAPLVPATIWILPAVGHSVHSAWFLINLAGAYFSFLAFGGITHLIIRANGWTGLRQYCSVMFLVTFVASFVVSIWSLSFYDQRYYLMTWVVTGGEITADGYLLEFLRAGLSAAIAAASMAVFWYVAVRGTFSRTEAVE